MAKTREYTEVNMNASIGFHEANQNGWVRLVKFAYGSVFSYSIMLSCKQLRHTFKGNLN